MHDSLYRNSIYLLLSSVIASLFGFIFWLIAAHLAPPSEIGIATTAISTVSLLATLSLFGWNNSLIKFLHEHRNKNSVITASFGLTTVISIILSAIYILNIHWLTPHIAYVFHSPVAKIILVITVAVSMLNILIESVFIAYKKSLFVFLKNALFTIGKVALLLILGSKTGYGLFLIIALLTVLSLIFSQLILYAKFGFHVSLINARPIIRDEIGYSLANYISSFFGAMSVLLLPVLVSNRLGSKDAAFYYIAASIAGVLYLIPENITKSLFSEAASDVYSLRYHTIRSTKFIISLLLPCILIIVIIGRDILLAFGEQYSSSDYVLLITLSISSIFVAITYICDAVFYVLKDNKDLLITNLLNAILVLGSIFVFMDRVGLEGVGIGWLIGQFLSSIVYVLFVFKKFPRLTQ